MELYVKWTGHVNTANKLEFVASVVECGIVALSSQLAIIV